MLSHSVCVCRRQGGGLHFGAESHVIKRACSPHFGADEWAEVVMICVDLWMGGRVVGASDGRVGVRSPTSALARARSYGNIRCAVGFREWAEPCVGMCGGVGWRQEGRQGQMPLACVRAFPPREQNARAPVKA